MAGMLVVVLALAAVVYYAKQRGARDVRATSEVYTDEALRRHLRR